MRRDYLEQRLGEIQRQLFRSLGGEFAFEGYKGALPSNYNKANPDSDPGFHDLSGDEYIKYRLKHQLDWHNNRINQRKSERRWMTIYVLAARRPWGITGSPGWSISSLGGIHCLHYCGSAWLAGIKKSRRDHKKLQQSCAGTYNTLQPLAKP